MAIYSSSSSHFLSSLPPPQIPFPFLLPRRLFRSELVETDNSPRELTTTTTTSSCADQSSPLTLKQSHAWLSTLPLTNSRNPRLSTPERPWSPNVPLLPSTALQRIVNPTSKLLPHRHKQKHKALHHTRLLTPPFVFSIPSYLITTSYFLSSPRSPSQSSQAALPLS